MMVIMTTTTVKCTVPGGDGKMYSNYRSIYLESYKTKYTMHRIITFSRFLRL